MHVREVLPGDIGIGIFLIKKKERNVMTLDLDHMQFDILHKMNSQL